MTDLNTAPPEAWPTWLAVEHEAVWLYGLIGGRVDDVSDEARAAWNRHRDTRDRLIAVLRAAGTTPDGPRLTYDAVAITTVADARRAAQAIEARVAVASIACLGDAAHRSETLAALRAAARAEASWGGQPTAFPGLS